jgi:hypothetical protein
MPINEKGCSTMKLNNLYFLQNVYNKRDFKAYEARKSGVY